MVDLRWLPGALACGLVGCGDGAATDVDGPPAASDAAPDPDASPVCSTPGETLDGTFLRDTVAVAFAPDGLAFLSFSSDAGMIARVGDGIGGPGWAELPDEPYIFQLAVHPATGRVYAASTGGLYELDGRAAAGTPTLVAPGQTRTVAIGPDGAVYYTSGAFGFDIHRMDAGVDTPVTATGFTEPSELVFDADGTILFVDLVVMEVLRITLDAGHHETARRVILTHDRRINAVGRDSAGVYYVVADDAVRQYTLDAGGLLVDPMVFDDERGYDLAFARGYLGCTQFYVTGAGELRSFYAGATGTP